MTSWCLTYRFPSGAAVGPGPTLGTDFHTRLNVAETASLLQKMPLGTLDWIEEPIRDESPEAYEELRERHDLGMSTLCLLLFVPARRTRGRWAQAS